MIERIGILAYGSLIEDPGKELKPLIIERIPNVKTPFSVEFARSSSSRESWRILGIPNQKPILLYTSQAHSFIEKHKNAP